jgi:hypothetical protein
MQSTQIKAMRIIYIILLSVTTLALTAYSSFKLESFSADHPADNRTAIRLTWEVAADQDVASYIILRQSADQTTRKQVHEADSRPGSETRKKYTFDDNTLYKTGSENGQQVTYFIQVKMKGSGQIIEPMNNQAKLTYTSTTVRRTWGSIKAMFQ